MTRLVGIDLFAGAGGMSQGARDAGIELLLAVESDRWAAQTYRANFPDVPVYRGDIRGLSHLPEPIPGALKILFGGPPCQGFSTSNQRTRSTANPHNWLFEEFLRVARIWEPDWIVFENVKGITETAGGLFLGEVLERLAAMQFRTSWALLNAKDFGVPQSRQRLFVVANRYGMKFQMPQPLLDRPLTVDEAIGDLPHLANGASKDTLPYRAFAQTAYVRSLRRNADNCSGHLVTRNSAAILERYEHVPPGGNWQDIPAALMANYRHRAGCHTGIYRRLDPTKPSVVIGNYRKNMLIHPHEDRGLSVREASRLQAVPDSFVFCGTIGFQQQQVGNMVPPPLSKAVFSLLAQCNGESEAPSMESTLGTF